MTPGADAVVVRVSDRSPELLRYLTDRGIVLGTRLQVTSVNPAASAIGVNVGGEAFELALAAATRSGWKLIRRPPRRVATALPPDDAAPRHGRDRR